MKNFSQLHELMGNYDRRMGMMRSLRSLTWVNELRAYLNGKEGELTESDVNDINAILENQGKVRTNKKGRLKASSQLAEEINNYIDHESKRRIFDNNLLINIFQFLRPEQIINKMALNKRLKSLLSNDEKYWTFNSQRHFRFEFDKIKSTSQMSSILIFRQLYESAYKGMSSRDKTLFSAAKSADYHDYQMMEPGVVDLMSRDKSGESLFDCIANGFTKSQLDEFYQSYVAGKVGESNYASPMIDGYYFIHWLVRLGQVEILSAFLEDYKDHVELESANKIRPLQLAACYGKIDIVLMLIQNGATIDHRLDQINKTPIYLAAQNGHDKVVSILIENLKSLAGDAKRTKRNIISPLVIACEQGHLAVVEQLLVAYREVVHTSYHKNMKSSPELAGTELREMTKRLRSAINIAVKNNHAEVVQMLLDSFKSLIGPINDNDSLTPLHLAAYYGHYHLAQSLLTFKADVDLKYNDKTAAQLAHDQGKSKVVELLSAMPN